MVTNLNFSVLMCSGPDEELGSVALQHEFIVEMRHEAEHQLFFAIGFNEDSDCLVQK